VAGKLLASPVVDTVIIGSVRREPPVVEAWAPTAGIVLGAGRATRYGATKQILPWEHSTLAARSAAAALEAGLDPVIVVLGHEAEKVEKTLAGMPVRTVLNSEFAEGQSTSVQKGVAALPPRTAAALFLLADQPFVTAGTIQSIVRAHRRTLAPLCVAACDGRRGNPALFDKALFFELGRLRGDEGGRALFNKYADALVRVPVSRATLLDIDTPEDYERLRKL
jgi:molybdenum cofactor cytidylyltransferase